MKYIFFLVMIFPISLLQGFDGTSQDSDSDNDVGYLDLIIGGAHTPYLTRPVMVRAQSHSNPQSIKYDAISVRSASMPEIMFEQEMEEDLGSFFGQNCYSKKTNDTLQSVASRDSFDENVEPEFRNNCREKAIRADDPKKLKDKHVKRKEQRQTKAPTISALPILVAHAVVAQGFKKTEGFPSDR